ncbi:hypothetical protein ACRDNQ_09520 [Palleronia sp. KMU-117]|uniref:hypothetical protein n=1 Tax=Palleronia sp. KMU-117 TaxID=3434108 RepID=UPI003D745103
MRLPERRPADIAVMAGTMASQQLAFAHLLDLADRAGLAPDMDAIEVLRAPDLERRLAHYFDPKTATRIVGAAGGCDTVILLTDPGALPACDSDRLRWLGIFPGQLLRALPERPC